MVAEGRDSIRAREVLDRVLDEPEPPAPSSKSHSRDVHRFNMTTWRKSVVDVMCISEMDRIIIQVSSSYSDMQLIEEKCTFEEIATMYAEKRIS